MLKIRQTIANFYAGLAGLLVPPMLTLLLAAWFLWPLRPAADNYFAEATLAMLILLAFSLLASLQTISLFCHLLGMRKFYVTTLTSATKESDVEVCNRILSVLSYPVDIMRLLGFSCIPVLGWAYSAHILRGNFRDQPWSSIVFRNFVFSTLIAVILGCGYFFSVLGQIVRPAEKTVDGKSLYGLVTAHDEWVVEPRFDEIRPFARRAMITPFRKGDRWGYLAKNGSVILEPVFEQISWWDADWWDEQPLNIFDNLLPKSNHLLPCRRNNQWGFIGTKGVWAISPQFEEVRPFSGRLWVIPGRIAAVKVGNLWGFIDRSGRMVVTPRFEMAFSLENYGEMGDRRKPRALVRLSGQWGMFQPPDSFETIADNEQLMPAGVGMAMGYIDNTGSFVLPPRYTKVGQFKHGFAVVETLRQLTPDAGGFSQTTPVHELIDVKGEVYAWKKTFGGRWIYQDADQKGEREDRCLEKTYSRRGRSLFLFVFQGMVGVLDQVNGMLLPPRYTRAEIESVIKAENL